jgi:hypothetical protein
MDRNGSVRIRGSMPLALVVLLLSHAAAAQEVNEDYIVNHLGPAAEAMQAAGVDGSPESSPAIIDISQRWGIGPAFWVSVDEVHMLVRAHRDGEVRSRWASVTEPLELSPSRLMLARFGVMPAGLTCQQAQQKALSAQRLADTLSRVSQLNGAGTGLVGAISQGAVRFVAPMAFATVVTSFAASWAGQLASAYRTAPCIAGGQEWRFRPNVLKTSLSPGLSHDPLSSPGRPGLRPAALVTGSTSRRPRMTSPSRSPWLSGWLRCS